MPTLILVRIPDPAMGYAAVGTDFLRKEESPETELASWRIFWIWRPRSKLVTKQRRTAMSSMTASDNVKSKQNGEKHPLFYKQKEGIAFNRLKKELLDVLTHS